MTVGVSRILRERKNQLTKWSRDHDEQEHCGGELAIAAGYLALRRSQKPKDMPLWAWKLQLKNTDDRLRQLEIAGALIAAEIERLVGSL